MATVKVKFRPSAVSGKEGNIYYQIIHKRVVRQIKAGYRIFPSEWNNQTCDIVMPDNQSSADCRNRLDVIRERINRDVSRITCIIEKLDGSGDYSVDKVVAAFMQVEGVPSFFSFMQDVIGKLQLMGKYRTVEAYTSTFRSFFAFRKGEDLFPDEINANLMQLYEAYLYNLGLVRNSISFYMRILRAVYNRAVDMEFTIQRTPFKNVYTGVDKTVKRAISLNAVRKLKEVDLSLKPSLEFARDLFMFSFYTRGMSFIDIAFLKKKDLQNGILTYRRHKTGQMLFVKWEKCMQEILDKYPSDTTDYLLPIIRISGDVGEERKQYRTALRYVNNKLKQLSALTGLDVNLTMYVSRHSWASAAKSRNIPTSVISEGMGHESEITTKIYLASLDTSAVDVANETILSCL